MYTEFLRHEGFLPIAVSTVADALVIVPWVDIVVTAVLLPGPTDGLELVSQLKRGLQQRRTPVIVLTACAWRTDRDRALAAGCDTFLSKPCLPAVLIRHIRRLLTTYRGPRTRPVASSRGRARLDVEAVTSRAS